MCRWGCVPVGVPIRRYLSGPVRLRNSSGLRRTLAVVGGDQDVDHLLPGQVRPAAWGVDDLVPVGGGDPAGWVPAAGVIEGAADRV